MNVSGLNYNEGSCHVHHLEKLGTQVTAAQGRGLSKGRDALPVTCPFGSNLQEHTQAWSGLDLANVMTANAREFLKGWGGGVNPHVPGQVPHELVCAADRAVGLS